MRKFVCSLLVLLMTFITLCGCDALLAAPNGSSSQNSTSSSSEIDEEVSGSLQESESNEDTPSVNTETGDMATGGRVGTLAPQNWGTTAALTLQTDVLSENSSTALKGVFNIDGTTPYQGRYIWTWAEFYLGEKLDDVQSLKNKAFTYDVKTENCGAVSSVILVSPEGTRTEEISFNLATLSVDGEAITRTKLNNGWTRVTIDFYMTYFNEPIVERASSILIMFSNQDCNSAQDSVFYIDNAKIVNFTSADELGDVTVNNPDGYYSKSAPLQVKIVGNSFVSPNFSNSAFFLQTFCDELGANVNVSYVSIGNGRIPDQHERAFGNNGYMYTEDVDVLLIQDFYSVSDAIALGEFLSKLYTLSPTTELKIYAGENETSDGLRAASHYGVDHVDWRTAIKTLKANHGFTTANLNAIDGWHPNELSGFVGGLMLYQELFGEMPDFNTVLNLAKEWVWRYIPGVDENEKTAAVGNIYTVVNTLISEN